jgi:DNA-binding response OmpR family regulator
MARRAVVVDDMEVVARTVSSVLKLEGFDEVRTVIDPRQALEVIRTTDPDLVVLDVSMPDLSGAQVIRAMGKRPGQRPALLVFTGTPREMLDLGLEGTELGYDVYLDKPANLKEIKASVRAALEAVARR